jgi:hypothetical protein
MTIWFSMKVSDAGDADIVRAAPRSARWLSACALGEAFKVGRFSTAGDRTNPAADVAQ